MEMIRPGQSVVMSPLTIVDVVNAVVLAGGIPHFVDITPHRCVMDLERADAAISPRTGAVLLTHLHGESADVCAFRDLFARRGVPLIEDAAQALGALEQGKRLGTFGAAGIYSFGLYKNVTAWQGGMVVSNDGNLLARIRRRLDALPRASRTRLLSAGLHGALTDVATSTSVFANLTYPVTRRGILQGNRWIQEKLDPESGARRLSALPLEYLGRMTGIQASLSIRQLDSVDASSQSRIEKAAIYHHKLKGMEGWTLPPARDDFSHIYTTYAIQVPERDALLHYAQSHRRDIAAQHLRNIADLPEFAEFGRDCPNARNAARSLVLLPTYPGYPDTEIYRNIEVMKRFRSVT
jgi:dTDP-4-amino-4,6-dideoxygalactose transaminase